MEELENIIKGLKCCTHAKAPIPCDYCPYVENNDYNDAWSCRIAVMKDALELLKEQKADIKTGKWIYGEDEAGQDGYACSECGFFEPWFYSYDGDICFIRKYKYCPNCKATMESYMHDVT